jgi:hypothetical protein
MKSRNRGQYKKAPEYAYASERPFDPFPLDVWCIGWMIKEEWVEVGGIQLLSSLFTHRSSQKYPVVMEFMRPLVDSMTQDAPKDRPTASESLQMLTELMLTLSMEAKDSYLDQLPPAAPSWFSRKVKWLGQSIVRTSSTS